MAQTQTQPPPTTPAEPAAESALLEVDRWTVTPFIGAGFSGDLNNSPINLGAALGYNWSSRLALEGAFGYMDAEQGQFFSADTNVWTVDANVLYHFTEQMADRQWAPYLAIGLGLVRASADLEDAPVGPEVDDTETHFAVNFGGGLKTSVSERVRLRGDLRYFTGDDVAPSFWRATAGLTFVLSR